MDFDEQKAQSGEKACFASYHFPEILVRHEPQRSLIAQKMGGFLDSDPLA